MFTEDFLAPVTAVAVKRARIRNLPQLRAMSLVTSLSSASRIVTGPRLMQVPGKLIKARGADH